MRISYSTKPHELVGYYPLPNGYVDVFLHKNEYEDLDEEGNIQYIAEEVYFQIKDSVTKEDIESNFEYFWEDAERDSISITAEDRLKALEKAMLEIILRGDVND